MLSFKPTFALSSFTLIKRLSSSSLSAIRVMSSAYLRLLIFLLEILIPVFASSSPAFLIPGSERTDGEGIGYSLQYSWASLVAQLVKNTPVMQETWV